MITALLLFAFFLISYMLGFKSGFESVAMVLAKGDHDEHLKISAMIKQAAKSKEWMK